MVLVSSYYEISLLRGRDSEAMVYRMDSETYGSGHPSPQSVSQVCTDTDTTLIAGVAQLGEQQTEAQRQGCILEVPCSIHGPGIFTTEASSGLGE